MFCPASRDRNTETEGTRLALPASNPQEMDNQGLGVGTGEQRIFGQQKKV
jgi:hypothetical protein